MKFNFVKTLFIASIVGFVVNSCSVNVYSIDRIDNSLKYPIQGYNNFVTISDNDTLNMDTIYLAVKLLNEKVKKKSCYYKYLNPIGTLMAFSFEYYWCNKFSSIEITSNNSFNAISSDELINDYFKSPYTDETLDEYLNKYFSSVAYEDDELLLICTSKPTEPLQQFKIKLTTDKGTFETETVSFYWL